METVTEAREVHGQSAGIEKLAGALVKAQGELTNPPKSKTVFAGQKRYRFAPLPEIIDAVRPVLRKNGLAVVQLVRERRLETRVVHESGQWMGATYGLPAIADSQAMGSAITYARRYSLCAILGIAAEDDEDGEAATAAEEEAKRKESEKVLDELKAKGRIKSAHDGKTLGAGEAPLPAERAGKGETSDHRPETLDPRPPEAGGDGLAGIAKPLAELMRRDGITPGVLQRYYVGKGHLPESVVPTALPPDYVTGLTKPENWKRAVASMKGAK